jgi:hypothetical protein
MDAGVAASAVDEKNTGRRGATTDLERSIDLVP